MGKKNKVKDSKAKSVSGWAKAAENIAKALAAVAGLAVCIIWNFGKNK